MIVGCDIGTSFTKAVLLENGNFVCGTKTHTEANPEKALQKALLDIAAQQEIDINDLGEVVVTGWGQERVSAAYQTETTIKCLAKAAHWDEPSCKTVLYMGAQQSVAIAVSDQGRVLGYQMNDKCASGAGQFLEIIYEALACDFEDSAEIAGAADKKLTMTSQCAVFAESEVVSLVNDGESVANILEAIFDSLARSLTTLGKKVNVKDTVVVGGGVAQNQRIVELLKENLGRQVHVFDPGPDYIAAFGAALSAKGGVS